MQRPTVKNSSDLGNEIISRARAYLGLPYQEHPLIGTHTAPEEFVATRTSFDCVTFVETVLAECFSAARSSNFEDELRLLRYRDGIVSWNTRLHYFSEWLTANSARGALRAVFPDLPVTSRTLSLLAHYPPSIAELRFLPCADIVTRQDELASGDILAFGTTRTNLDVSHTGFLEVSAQHGAMLLHATKRFGKVIEESLDEFLSRLGECPGLLVYRPILSFLPASTKNS